MKKAKNTQIYQVPEERCHERLDVFLAEQMGISRTKIQKMIIANQVTLDGREPKKAGERLTSTKQIEVKEEDTSIKDAENKIKAKKLPKLDVVAETADYIVVNKPSGILVHPTQAGEVDTLVNMLLAKYPEIKNVGEAEVRPGIVHRLDKEASGLLVIARTQKSFESLKKQFQDRSVDKLYSVLVYGQMNKDTGQIDFDIDRGGDGRMVSRPKIDKMKLRNISKIQDGKEALTEYWVEEKYKRFSLLKVKIHSGRTHQIRVHMYALGCPVVGDPLYCNKKLQKKSDGELNRLFLHARHLEFTDLKGERVSFDQAIPASLKNYLQSLV
ncbi:MAG: RluA family pseudouridine synthase [Candidatus Magasanikbacteria bacterium CG_4_10_14_0_2_um_filter_33_14]|uniref:Pseudouridine synthase n=1 Tax=Candidatus Magasanikbacteria bacterium CG_4_10_14_0_2_um_filter_33_14 TaxID=1974636 RepID=A0A2M7VB50_9BACT|nr:MAG: RluA family pseudouridine synthase [Candidatus Magasanikbacteria bacterium CG_4_10_14_0_2_um_filter_33_14]